MGHHIQLLFYFGLGSLLMVPELCIWSILLINSDLKLCIYLVKSFESDWTIKFVYGTRMSLVATKSKSCKSSVIDFDLVPTQRGIWCQLMTGEQPYDEILTLPVFSATMNISKILTSIFPWNRCRDVWAGCSGGCSEYRPVAYLKTDIS